MAKTTPKEKRQRLAGNSEFLQKLISVLENEKVSKEQLAEKLGLDNVKKITDGVLLNAVRLAGNSKFLANITEKASGRVKRTLPQYSIKKGLVVPGWQLEGRGIGDGQRYEMTFGSRKGIITLHPIDDCQGE